MADELGTERVHRISRVMERPRQHGGASHQPAFRSRRDAGRDEEGRPLSPGSAEDRDADAASVLGLPESALTPEVLDVLHRLLEDIDALRAELLLHEQREAELAKPAQRHCVAPLLNRRGFMSALDRALVRGTPDGMLIVFHVEGIEALRRVYGLFAGDGALRHAAAAVLGVVGEENPAGLLGGSDFAVLMPGAGDEAARRAAAETARRVNDPPFTWLDQPIRLPVGFGTHRLVPGEGGEQALAAADRARRGME